MTPKNPTARRRQPALALALTLGLAAGFGCTPQAMRGGPGTENPDLDAAAMSVKLDREDITYMVVDYLQMLQSSAYWNTEIKGASKPPIMAIWPIQNQTAQHIEDQMLTLLSSIETALVNTAAVQVVDRGSQEALAREIGVQQGSAYNPVYAQQLGRQIGAQYFVTGRITSVDEKLGNQHRVQYSLFLQVLEIETGLLKFQNEVTRTKEVKR